MVINDTEGRKGVGIREKKNSQPINVSERARSLSKQIQRQRRVFFENRKRRRCNTALRSRGEVEYKAAEAQTKRRPRYSDARNSVATSTHVLSTNARNSEARVRQPEITLDYAHTNGHSAWGEKNPSTKKMTGTQRCVILSPTPNLRHWSVSNRKIDGEKRVACLSSPSFLPSRRFEPDQVTRKLKKKILSPVDGAWSLSTPFNMAMRTDVSREMITLTSVRPRNTELFDFRFSFFLSWYPDFVESLTDSIWFLKILYLFLSPSNKADTK